MLELGAVVDVITVLSVNASGVVVGADESVADSVVIIVAAIAVLLV